MFTCVLVSALAETLRNFRSACYGGLTSFSESYIRRLPNVNRDTGGVPSLYPDSASALRASCSRRQSSYIMASQLLYHRSRARLELGSASKRSILRRYFRMSTVSQRRLHMVCVARISNSLTERWFRSPSSQHDLTSGLHPWSNQRSTVSEFASGFFSLLTRLSTFRWGGWDGHLGSSSWVESSGMAQEVLLHRSLSHYARCSTCFSHSVDAFSSPLIACLLLRSI